MSPKSTRNLFPTWRRVRGLLAPAALAALLFGLLALPGLAANFSNRFKLSTGLPYKAFSPDVAASPNYVAVVWSEGYNSLSATKHWGTIYLKSADPANGWEGRINVFKATADAWAREPRLAFHPGDPDQVHVVWAQASGCSTGVCNWNTIRRAVCSLSGRDSCTISTVATGRQNAATPDIAVDNGGGMHVIWRDGPGEGTGSIRYCKNTCGSSPEQADTGQHPSLAFANNYLHLVWDTGPEDASMIKYERDANPGNTAWDAAAGQTWWNGSHPTYHEPAYPALGAHGQAVYVAWGVKQKSSTDRYALAFDASFDNGGSWTDDSDPASDFGRGIPENDRASFTTVWKAAALSTIELYSLQPDVVVTGTGTAAFAHLVWHGRETTEGGGVYQTWYSYLAGYQDGRDWQAPAKVVAGTHEDLGFAAIAVGSALSETHVAAVEDANSASFATIDVWYVGAYGNRDNDVDRFGGIKLPIIFKN